MSNFSVKVKLEDAGYNVDAFDASMIESFRIAVGGLAKAAQNEWVRIAQGKLRTSAEIYINGLRQSESFQTRSVSGIDTFEISLVGKMPNNFEFGMESFDMKAVRPGWLGGGKARTAKDGHKYIAIPFRHSTSDSPRMRYTGKAAAIGTGPMTRGSLEANLKTQLRKAVSEYGLNRMVRAGSGQVIAGPVRRIPKSAPVHPYLKGLTRVQTPSSGTTSSGKQRGSSSLITWRIMSENSPASSWIHPGLPAANLLQEVESFVDSQMDKIIEQIVGT